MKDKVSSHYNATSFLLKITQFTYKTFKCNELLKWSRCCKLSTFALFLLLRKNLLFLLSMYAPAPILFSLCVHSMEGDSSRTQISPWGMERWQRCMPRPLLFSGPWEEKHWHRWQAKCDIFCTVIPRIFKLMPCLEIDRRRCNECASVTQRRATRTLWDLGSVEFWLVCFLKHRGPAVDVIQI